MDNPYSPPPPDSSNGTPPQRPSVYPDWKWMTVMVYLFCAFCMLGIFGRENPPESAVIGFGHGFMRGVAYLGTGGFAVLLPVLAAVPTTIIAWPMRRFYQPGFGPNKTWVNYAFLACGVIIAIINASLYRGD